MADRIDFDLTSAEGEQTPLPAGVTPESLAADREDMLRRLRASATDEGGA